VSARVAFRGCFMAAIVLDGGRLRPWKGRRLFASKAGSLRCFVTHARLGSLVSSSIFFLISTLLMCCKLMED